MSVCISLRSGEFRQVYPVSSGLFGSIGCLSVSGLSGGQSLQYANIQFVVKVNRVLKLELLQNDLVPMHAAVETLASGRGVALFVS